MEAFMIFAFNAAAAVDTSLQLPVLSVDPSAHRSLTSDVTMYTREMPKREAKRSEIKVLGK
jgi:hypothetical protein